VDNSREDLNLRLDDIIMPQIIFAPPFERYYSFAAVILSYSKTLLEPIFTDRCSTCLYKNISLVWGAGGITTDGVPLIFITE